MPFPARTCLALILATSAIGCASAKFDADRTRAVKKMAVIAIEIQQQQPKDALGVASISQMKTGKAVGDSPELQDMALGVYGQTVYKVSGRTGWTVLSLEALKNNPVYKKQVQSSMEGMRTVSMVGGDYQLVSLKGTLDAHAFKKLSDQDKIKIAKALGVDAVGVLTIYMDIDQGWSIGNLTGKAPFSLKARSNFEVYDLRDEKPIWRIQNVDGEPSAKSETLSASLTPKQKMSILGKAAAESSLNKLVQSYQR